MHACACAVKCKHYLAQTYYIKYSVGQCFAFCDTSCLSSSMSEPPITNLKRHLSCWEPADVSIQQLWQHMPEFLRHLDVSVIIPALREAALLSENEAWHLTNCDRSPRERIVHLLTFILVRKGNEGPNKFVECIRRTSDCHPPHRRLVRLFCSKFSVQNCNRETTQKKHQR